MKKISIQFHALADECAQFIREWVDKHNLKVAIIQYFPKFAAQTLNSCERLLEELDSLGDCTHRVVALDLTGFNCTTKSSSEFDEKNPNSLLLEFGEESVSCLREAWLRTTLFLADESASKCWQAIARNLKKRTVAGAWAENPKTGGRSFYRNHRYTEGARDAQANGVVLAPPSGHVFYDVLSEAPS